MLHCHPSEVLHCNYKEEIGPKIKFGHNFWLEGPFDTRSTRLIWTAFCKIFSGTPHLTIFGAPKYAPKYAYLAYLAIFKCSEVQKYKVCRLCRKYKVCNYAGDPKCASRIHRRLLTTSPSSLATVANWHHGKWFKFDIRSSTGWYLLQSTGILVSIKRFQIGDKVNWSEEKEHTCMWRGATKVENEKYE